jgi:hypothetical protein
MLSSVCKYIVANRKARDLFTWNVISAPASLVIGCDRTPKEITMSATTLTNNQAALSYALSELGEVMHLASSGATLSSNKDVNGAQVLAPGTTIAQGKVHVAAVHPQLAAGLIKD